MEWVEAFMWGEKVTHPLTLPLFSILLYLFFQSDGPSCPKPSSIIKAGAMDEIKVYPVSAILGIDLKERLKRLKMTQGRGSAGKILGLGLVFGLVWFLSLLQNADAAVYTVGGSGGWTFNVESWPQGKRFRAGDLLRFNYDSSNHNVVVVNKAGYGSCRTPARSKVYNSGKDLVKLAKGVNYFICNFPGHCESQMKIAVNAL